MIPVGQYGQFDPLASGQRRQLIVGFCVIVDHLLRDLFHMCVIGFSDGFFAGLYFIHAARRRFA